jgi:hypothetical protein
LKQTLAIYVLVFLALVGANLPFLTERVFAVLPFRRAGAIVAKPFWLRFVELVVLYLLIGLIGRGFEASLGNVFPQGWQFYAITFVLFLVLAFPGFVHRYLMRKRIA